MIDWRIVQQVLAFSLGILSYGYVTWRTLCWARDAKLYRSWLALSVFIPFNMVLLMAEALYATTFRGIRLVLSFNGTWAPVMFGVWLAILLRSGIMDEQRIRRELEEAERVAE